MEAGFFLQHNQENKNNENDYSYFVEYYLGIILKAYKEFTSRVEYITNKKMNAKELDNILKVIEDAISQRKIFNC